MAYYCFQLCFAPLAGLERPIKIIQHDEANSHIVQGCSHCFLIFERLQLLVGRLIAVQSFREPVLSVIDVGYVDFEAGEAPLVACLKKYLSRAFPRPKCPLIIAEQNQRLDSTAQGSAHLFEFSGLLETSYSKLKHFDGRRKLTGEPKRIRLGPVSKAQSLRILDLFSYGERSVSEPESSFRIYPDFLPNRFSELPNDGALKKGRPAGEPGPKRGTVLMLPKLDQQRSSLRRFDGFGVHQNPRSSSFVRRRLRQRMRMKPIEPFAIPSFFATSSYGIAGAVKNSIRISS